MLNLFVNTWGNYNVNGADGGQWLTLPMDPEELQEALSNIAAAMGDHDPEWAIHDYEWESEMELGDVHEMDSITECITVCLNSGRDFLRLPFLQVICFLAALIPFCYAVHFVNVAELHF